MMKGTAVPAAPQVPPEGEYKCRQSAAQCTNSPFIPREHHRCRGRPTMPSAAACRGRPLLALPLLALALLALIPTAAADGPE